MRTGGKDEVNEAILSIALNSIRDGKFTIQEAESIFKIKIPENLYESKNTYFYVNEKTPDYNCWAKFFIDKNKYFMSADGQFIYDNELKHYRRISEEEIDYMLTKDTSSFVKPNHRNHFIRTLKASSYKSSHEMKNPHGFVNLKNGILDVSSGKLSDHDSNKFFTYCLPHDYDSNATCPKWIKFLDEVFAGNSELKFIASMIFGYILIGGNPWLHQAFVLIGEGRNGKSTFLDVLRSVIGYDNFTSVSLSKLDHSFSVVNLDGKLANIIEETPNDKINAEVFKTAIGGGQLMGSKKYQDEYSFQCKARFIFACNEMPKFSENSVGLIERLYFIPFNTYFTKENRNTNILNELLQEIPGILNWSLSGLNLLLDSKIIPKCDASLDALETYRLESDSVYQWACDNVSVDFESTVIVSSRTIYQYYVASLKDSGRHPVSDMTFFKRFKKYLKTKHNYKNDMFLQKNKSYKGVLINSQNNQFSTVL